MKNKKMKEIIKLYEYLGLDVGSIGNDIKCDYLSEHIGRDGQGYYWFLNAEVPGQCAAINVSTGEIVDDEVCIEELFC